MYSLRCIIQCVREIKIHSVETVSKVSQKSSKKIVTYAKRDQKVKRPLKNIAEEFWSHLEESELHKNPA